MYKSLHSIGSCYIIQESMNVSFNTTITYILLYTTNSLHVLTEDFIFIRISYHNYNDSC